MFNNPFDSFHKTVGKAKKEREQLDRLLTISTPGELTLVVLAAAVLLLFAAWLIFGSVTRSVSVDAVLVAPGGQIPGENPPVEAVVWLERDLARQIEAGMPAVLELAYSKGEGRSLDGELALVFAVPPADGAAPFESAAPVTMHRVHIALDQDLDFSSLDGAECRLLIQLGSQSPLAFFARRPS